VAKLTDEERAALDQLLKRDQTSQH
jgi:hypothetical protein